MSLRAVFPLKELEILIRETLLELSNDDQVIGLSCHLSFLESCSVRLYLVDDELLLLGSNSFIVAFSLELI